jgi:RNA polymerase sigma-54 factor
MKPLVLREIADELGLHESTISRVTTAKYMATPHGTFELKYFFGSVAEHRGRRQRQQHRGARADPAARGAEDPAKPLSDSQLSEMLERAGHPGGAAHGGQVPRGAEDRAGLAAQDAL